MAKDPEIKRLLDEAYVFSVIFSLDKRADLAFNNHPLALHKVQFKDAFGKVCFVFTIR